MAKILIFLIIMHKSDGKLLNRQQIAGMKRLGYPQNYYKGTLPFSLSLPRNILIWFDTNPVSRTGISFHYRYLLVCPVSGRGKAIVDDGIVEIGENTCLLIFPFQFHHFIYENHGREWIFIGFESEELSMLNCLKCAPFKLTESLSRLMSMLVDGYLNDMQDKVVNNRTPLILALFLNELMLVNRKHNVIALQSKTTNPTIETVIHREICSDLNLSIKSLGQRIGYSESRLRALYRSAHGISIGKVVRTIKFSKAEALLASTNQKIDSIAHTCGFGSLYAFSLAFKKRFGVSPRDYRNMTIIPKRNSILS